MVIFIFCTFEDLGFRPDAVYSVHNFYIRVRFLYRFRSFDIFLLLFVVSETVFCSNRSQYIQNVLISYKDKIIASLFHHVYMYVVLTMIFLYLIFFVLVDTWRAYICYMFLNKNWMDDWMGPGTLYTREGKNLLHAPEGCDLHPKPTNTWTRTITDLRSMWLYNSFDEKRCYLVRLYCTKTIIENSSVFRVEDTSNTF